MNRLHQALVLKVPYYGAWHDHPLSEALHWALFLFFSCAMSGSVLSSGYAYADVIEEPVTVESVATSTVSESSTPVAAISTEPTEQTAPIEVSASSTPATNASSTDEISIEVEAATTTVATTTATTTETVVQADMVSTTTLPDVPALSLSVIADAIIATSTQEAATTSIDIADANIPIITEFKMSGLSRERDVPIRSFVATDDRGISGYIITRSSGKPSIDDPAWRSDKPTVYSANKNGIYILYVWVKDAAGNVSAPIKVYTTVIVPTD